MPQNDIQTSQSSKVDMVILWFLIHYYGRIVLHVMAQMKEWFRSCEDYDTWAIISSSAFAVNKKLIVQISEMIVFKEKKFENWANTIKKKTVNV